MSEVCLDQRMAIKLGKNGKLPGENIIQAGLVFCFLGVALYIISGVAGAINGFTLLGGGVLGLLIICVGYLKRISAVLLASNEVTAAEPAVKV